LAFETVSNLPFLLPGFL